MKSTAIEIENEIYFLEELIASLSLQNKSHANDKTIDELNIQLIMLRNKLNKREELHNDDTRPLSMGGKV